MAPPTSAGDLAELGGQIALFGGHASQIGDQLEPNPWTGHLLGAGGRGRKQFSASSPCADQVATTGRSILDNSGRGLRFSTTWAMRHKAQSA